MNYPPEFIEKAKQIWPNWTTLHELIEAGKGEIVGRILNENIPSGEALELAQLVINPEKTSEAYTEAVRIILKKTLWKEWLALEKTQTPAPAPGKEIQK